MPVRLKGKLFTIFCLLWICAHSRDTLVVDHSFQQIDILSVGSLYSTPDAEMDIEVVQQLPQSDWKPLSATGTVLYSLDQVYWVKSTLKNEGQQTLSVYIEVGNKRINELQFFVRRDTGLFTSEVTGDYHPFHRRVIQHPSMICPVELGVGETVTIYINYIKTGETISLDTRLWEKKYFERTSRRDGFLMAMFFGFALCILLWSVFIALFLGAPLFRYFVIYIFACIAMALIVTGYGAMYLWPNNPYFNGLSYFSLSIYYLSLIQIIRIYFKTAETLVRFDIFYRIAGSLLLVLTVLTVLHWSLPSLLKVASGKFGLALLLLINIAIIWTCFASFRKFKNCDGLLFLTGFLFCLTAIVLFDLEQMFAISTPWGIGMTLIAILLDLSILMWLFTRKIREAYLNKSQLEQELAQSRFLAADALLEGQMEERRRLSQDLHDGISIKLALFKRKLERYWPQRSPETEELMEDVGLIAEDIRAFTHAIAPIKLEEQQLEEAVEDLVYEVEKATELDVQVEFDLQEHQIAPKVKYALFYTFQELLNNTVKHAQARAVVCHWQEEKQRVYLQYEDDGIGFDTTAPAYGIGFKNIQARANLLNGGFRFSSNRRGSRFSFWVERSEAV